VIDFIKAMALLGIKNPARKQAVYMNVQEILLFNNFIVISSFLSGASIVNKLMSFD